MWLTQLTFDMVGNACTYHACVCCKLRLALKAYCAHHMHSPSLPMISRLRNIAPCQTSKKYGTVRTSNSQKKEEDVDDA